MQTLLPNGKYKVDHDHRGHNWGEFKKIWKDCSVELVWQEQGLDARHSDDRPPDGNVSVVYRNSAFSQLHAEIPSGGEVGVILHSSSQNRGFLPRGPTADIVIVIVVFASFLAGLGVRSLIRRGHKDSDNDRTTRKPRA